MLTLKQKIESDLLVNMRSKNEVGKNTLRMLLSAIKLYEIEKSTTIDDNGVLSLIQKELKSRRDSINDFQKGNRQDLVDDTLREVDFLENYLPTQLTNQEIETIVKNTMLEVGASSPSDIGKVMKAVIPRISGQATTDRVSTIVRDLLNKNLGI
jgi:uncharacterized protein YqeY